jgi:hypothetical protein
MNVIPRSHELAKTVFRAWFLRFVAGCDALRHFFDDHLTFQKGQLNRIER